jgi:uncharacterized protein (TIGR02598 family)
MKVHPMHESPRVSRRAFTLVETVLAIGIVSFALVAIMGLLPCGLQVFRKAMDTTLEGQMIQQLTGMMGQTPYSDLAQLQGKSFSFDDAGNFVEATSTDGIYTATVTLNAQPALPGAQGQGGDGLTGVTMTFQRKGETGPVGATRTFVTYIAAKSRVVR